MKTRGARLIPFRTVSDPIDIPARPKNSWRLILKDLQEAKTQTPPSPDLELRLEPLDELLTQVEEERETYKYARSKNPSTILSPWGDTHTSEIAHSKRRFGA